MAGVNSAAQFVPRSSDTEEGSGGGRGSFGKMMSSAPDRSADTEYPVEKSARSSFGNSGIAYPQEVNNPMQSLAPSARGALSPSSQMLSMRAHSPVPLPLNKDTMGSWLFRPDVYPEATPIPGRED